MEHKLSTINVVEYVDDEVTGITSFADPDGGTEAEEHFRKIIGENAEGELTEEEMADCLEEGYFEQGTYQAFLKASN